MTPHYADILATRSRSDASMRRQHADAKKMVDNKTDSLCLLGPHSAHGSSLTSCLSAFMLTLLSNPITIPPSRKSTH
jgi:hypothetical protein